MLGKPLGTFGGAYIAFGQDNPSQLFNTLPPGQGSSHMLGTQLGETLPAGGPCMEFKQPGKPWLLGSTLLPVQGKPGARLGKGPGKLA